MSNKVTVGPAQVDPQVSIGKVQTTGYDVGPVSIDGGSPGQAVGAPAAPGGPSPLAGNAVVPFSEFYAAVQGNPQLAEELVPGITTRQGAKLLKMGQDGKPQVELKTVNQMAKFDQLLRQYHARKSEPEYVPYQNQPFDEKVYPGATGSPIGYLPYIKQDPGGPVMIRNPKHPKTAEIAQQISARQQPMSGSATAEDGE